MALITPTEAKARKGRGWVHIDIRSKVEFEKISIPNSINVPFGNFHSNPRQFQANVMKKVPLSRKIIISCEDGRESNFAAVRLSAAGFSNVAVLYRGIKSWEVMKRFPVRRGQRS